MNTQSLKKEFARYLFPIVASMVSLSCYILADTYFVSAGVGGIGLAGLNIALPTYSLINTLGLMLGIGAGVVIAVSHGEGNQQCANEALSCALLLGLFLGITLTILGVTLDEPIVRLLGASENSLPYAATYLRTLAAFSVFFLCNRRPCAQRRPPRLAMISMIACLMSNVVLDYLFIMQFDWGLWGAAFATGLAPVKSVSAKACNRLQAAATGKATIPPPASFCAWHVDLRHSRRPLFCGGAAVPPFPRRDIQPRGQCTTRCDNRPRDPPLLCGIPVHGDSVCCASWFQSVLRPKSAAVISLLRAFVPVIAGVALLLRLLGLDGVWLVVPAAELLTGMVSVALIRAPRHKARNEQPQNASPGRNGA